VHLGDYISRLGFNVWQPETGRAGDRRLAVPRTGEDAKLLQLPRAPVDAVNVVLPPGFDSLHGMVAPECRMERMSTLAVASVINRAVATMPAGHSYINVGTWAGFTLRAGMYGNPDKTCVGIDDFSMFGGPREGFHSWFDRLRSPSHHFHEMDYRDYFDRVHEGPIGVYFYDGDHAYEHQLLGLQTAERFFGDECIVIVDDTNWPEPYEATFDFIAQSEREYTVLLDQQTVGNGHPTFWNGLLILHTGTPTRSAPPARGEHRPLEWLVTHYDPVRMEPEPPLVSIVLRNLRSSPQRVEAAFAEARAQRWPSVEVVLADEGTELTAAIDRTGGDYVAVVDTEDRLVPAAVEIGVAYPQMSEFNRDLADPLLEGLRRWLDSYTEALAVVPRGGSIALANGRLPVPLVDSGRRLIPFLDTEQEIPGDEGLVERLAGVRDAGIAYLVLGWRSFDLLQRSPRFRDELDARATRVLEHEDVLVYELSR
jgi:hypothetical protein